MRELAKLANVSVSTVSKAFCNADDVSLETKERVLSLAKEHGCYGKYYKGKFYKKIIALIVPEIRSKHYVAYIDCLRELIETDDGICLISVFDFSAAKQNELVDYYASFLKVDGIIVFGLKNSLKKGYSVPIVSIFPSIDASVDSVSIDISAAMRDAVLALTERGHKKIAFISEKLTATRAEQYKMAMASVHNADILTVVSNERFEKAGIDGVNMLLEMKAEFTAIICAYDYIAFGAIKQLKNVGLSVPNDISVIGIDNVAESEYTETSLSTIDLSPREVSQITYDVLKKKLKNPYFRTRQSIVINAQLVLRESISNAKQ